MCTSPDFDTLRSGDKVPGLRISVDTVQQFFFSAAEYMGHRIHYDHLWSTAVEGHEAILVSTTLLEATMHRMLAEWAGPKAWISRLSLQNHDKVYPREELIFNAAVRAAKREGEQRIIDLNLSIEKTNGAGVMSGAASIITKWRGDAAAGR